MSTKTRKILVPQPEPPKKSSPYYQLAEEYGLELVFKPLFHFETLTTRQFRDQKVDILKHTAVILTSRSPLPAEVYHRTQAQDLLPGEEWLLVRLPDHHLQAR